jgi:uncharacterized protein (TIGR00725 family)
MAQNRRLIVAVVGPGECDEATSALGFEVGKLLAERGCLIVTGGRGGVMEAASAGAASVGGEVIGILPGEGRDQANPHVSIPIVTGMGETRNAIIARTADAMIALSGGFGTLSEIAFALKFGKPVVSLGSWQVSPQIHAASAPPEAIEIVLRGLTTPAL